MARINDETHQINALATWNVIHDKQVVFLSGIIGDRAFLQYMLQAWRTTHPHYDLMYFRKGKPVRRKHNAILTHN